MDQNNGLEVKVSKEENRTTLTMVLREISLLLIRISLPDFTYGNNNPNNGRSYDPGPNQPLSKNDGTRSRNGSFNNHNGNWQNNRNLTRSPSTQREDFSQNNSYRQAGSDQPHNSASRRSDNRPTTGFAPNKNYEQISRKQ